MSKRKAQPWQEADCGTCLYGRVPANCNAHCGPCLANDSGATFTHHTCATEAQQRAFQRRIDAQIDAIHIAWHGRPAPRWQPVEQLQHIAHAIREANEARHD